MCMENILMVDLSHFFISHFRWQWHRWWWRHFHGNCAVPRIQCGVYSGACLHQQPQLGVLHFQRDRSIQHRDSHRLRHGTRGAIARPFQSYCFWHYQSFCWLPLLQKPAQSAKLWQLVILLILPLFEAYTDLLSLAVLLNITVMLDPSILLLNLFSFSDTIYKLNCFLCQQFWC